MKEHACNSAAELAWQLADSIAQRLHAAIDLRGHAVIHTAPNVKKVDKSAAHPAGYAPVCIGTTTSDRMERFTRPLMKDYGVRMIIGKGGLREGSAAAFSELGGAYLAIVGGTAALETTWVEQIEDVDMDDDGFEPFVCACNCNCTINIFFAKPYGALVSSG